MKYNDKERIEIGRQVYSGDLSRFEAGEEYGISPDTARNYMRLYRDAYDLPAKRGKRRNYAAASPAAAPAGLADFKSMTREELIHELLMARINEARLKKGYEVKWDGTVILYGNGNTK